MHRPARPTRCGFTLIEMIVVIMVMAIMATLILPRLFGNDHRQFQNVADQVSDLLMMYAQRESLGTKPVGLWEDTDRRQLTLMTLEVLEDSLETQSGWVIDRTVRPVSLPNDVSILDVHVDGESVDISEWPLQSPPGQLRPSLAIILEGPNGIITIAMASHSLVPLQIHSEQYGEWMGGPVDLDAAGRDREDW